MTEKEDLKLPRLFLDEDADPAQIETRLLEPGRILGHGRKRSPWLFVLSGAHSGEMHLIKSGMTIGRAIGSDIVIEEAGISRRHALARVLATGQVLIEDVGSSNGIYRGAERVQRVVLGDGDRVNLGDVQVAVMLLEDREHDLHLVPDINDPATRLPNRGFLLATLRDAIDYAATYDVTLCFVLLLIDQWRDVCDTHGRTAGDALVAQVASIARNVLQSDEACIGRASEEEIGLVLPDTDRDQAVRCAECIRRAVEASPARPSSAIDPIRLTVSGGVALWTRQSEIDPATLVEQARHQLCHAVLVGRNCIVPQPVMSSSPAPT
jgi:diguanylate cyclase (GGDEF)-like protein